jgi:hypothetical protein
MHGSPPENSDKLPAAPRPKGYCDETQHGERNHHDMKPEDRLSYRYGEWCVHFLSVFIARYRPACYAGECARLQAMGSSGRSDAARRLHRGRRPQSGLGVQFIRYRDDDSVIGSFRSLWIVTEDGGRWAVPVPSSFAG